LNPPPLPLVGPPPLVGRITGAGGRGAGVGTGRGIVRGRGGGLVAPPNIESNMLPVLLPFPPRMLLKLPMPVKKPSEPENIVTPTRSGSTSTEVFMLRSKNR